MISYLRNFVEFGDKGVLPLELSKEEFLEQVMRLESEINHKLIVVSKQEGIRLTTFGTKFLPHARNSLRTLYEGLQTASDINVYDLENILTLGVAKDSVASWAMNCIKNFNKMHPGLKLSIIADDSLSQRMTENATIIFWCVNDKELKNFNKLWYIEYKYGLYASEDYINRYGVPTLDNLAKHRIIAYSGSDNNASITNWHLTPKYGISYISPSIYCQSRDLIVKMTSEGLGIGAICQNQEVYYGYKSIVRVLDCVNGPILKSYFCIRDGITQQMWCNANLLNKLFTGYFLDKGIPVYEL
jgi:DNA-binding transcriptional LysR family regulator